MQLAIKAAKSGDWSETDGVVTAGGIVLEPAEYELALTTVDGASGQGALGLLPGGGFVMLHTETTPELEAEGVARDAIRAVQEARKQAGLDVSDRIVLVLGAARDDERALAAHTELIAAETLATTIELRVADHPASIAAAADWLHSSTANALGTEKAPLFIAIDRVISAAERSR